LRPARAASRTLGLELLECRRVMTADGRNPALPEDVDGSGFISLTDVLAIVSALRNNDAAPINLSEIAIPEGPPLFLDVTGDNICSLQDLLAVILPLREGANVPAPTLEAGLANDTPSNTADGVTTDATLAGWIMSNLLPGTHLVAVFEQLGVVRIVGVPSGDDGSFSFVPEVILGATPYNFSLRPWVALSPKSM